MTYAPLPHSPLLQITIPVSYHRLHPWFLGLCCPSTSYLPPVFSPSIYSPPDQMSVPPVLNSPPHCTNPLTHGHTPEGFYHFLVIGPTNFIAHPIQRHCFHYLSCPPHPLSIIKYRLGAPLTLYTLQPPIEPFSPRCYPQLHWYHPNSHRTHSPPTFLLTPKSLSPVSPGLLLTLPLLYPRHQPHPSCIIYLVN